MCRPAADRGAGFVSSWLNKFKTSMHKRSISQIAKSFTVKKHLCGPLTMVYIWWTAFLSGCFKWTKVRHVYCKGIAQEKSFYLNRDLPQGRGHSCPTRSLRGWGCPSPESLQTKPQLVSGDRDSVSAHTWNTHTHTFSKLITSFEKSRGLKENMSVGLAWAAGQQGSGHHLCLGLELWGDSLINSCHLIPDIPDLLSILLHFPCFTASQGTLNL